MQNEIEAALAAKLRGDVTLMDLAPGGVHGDEAPQDIVGDYIVVAYFAGSNRRTFKNRRPRLEDLVYRIVGVTPGNSKLKAVQMGERVLDLLDGQPLDAGAGVAVLSVTCESRLSYPEGEGDNRYQNCGGLFRIVAQAL